MEESRGTMLRWCGWFLLCVAVLFVLLALRYLAVVQLPAGVPARTFTFLMFVSHSVRLAFIAFLLVLPVVLVWPRRRWTVSFAFLVALGWLLLTVIDGFVWQQYRLHLDAGIWNLVFGGAFSETFEFAPRTWATLAAITLVLAVALAACARIAQRLATRPGRRAGPIVALSLVAIVVMHNGFHAWANAAAYTPVTGQTRILPYHRALTAKRWLRSHGLMPDPVPSVHLSAGIGLNYPRSPLDCAPSGRPLNLLFVVIDSWRGDALVPAVTPNLSRLADESRRFTRHVSGGNATRIGLFSLFYGLPGTYWHDMLGERRGALLVQEALRQDYEVAVFRSAPLFSPEFDRTIFTDVPGLRLRSDGSRAWQRDRDVTMDYADWLARRDAGRPFFALLFYDSPHKFDFPPDWPLQFVPSVDQVDYLALSNRTDPQPLLNRYLNSLRYVDRVAGAAVDATRERGVLENTLLLVTSDHGQEFNDQRLNYWGHNSNFSPYQTHVPLFLRWPGESPSIETHATSHFDVAPTLLERVFGCRNPPADFSVGQDLFDRSERGVLTLATFHDFAAVIPGKRQVIVRHTGDIEALGPDYLPRPISSADREALQQALEQRSRFRLAGDRS